MSETATPTKPVEKNEGPDRVTQLESRCLALEGELAKRDAAFAALVQQLKAHTGLEYKPPTEKPSKK